MNGIPLRWSDSGPVGVDNAFGEIVSTEYSDGMPVPVICQHGGSMWLCRGCKDRLMAQKPDLFRVATPEERDWCKNPTPEFPPKPTFWERLRRRLGK
jgi:hypothetical protein